MLCSVYHTTTVKASVFKGFMNFSRNKLILLLRMFRFWGGYFGPVVLGHMGWPIIHAQYTRL